MSTPFEPISSEDIWKLVRSDPELTRGVCNIFAKAAKKQIKRDLEWEMEQYERHLEEGIKIPGFLPYKIERRIEKILTEDQLQELAPNLVWSEATAPRDEDRVCDEIRFKGHWYRLILNEAKRTIQIRASLEAAIFEEIGCTEPKLCTVFTSSGYGKVKFAVYDQLLIVCEPTSLSMIDPFWAHHSLRKNIPGDSQHDKTSNVFKSATCCASGAEPAGVIFDIRFEQIDGSWCYNIDIDPSNPETFVQLYNIKIARSTRLVWLSKPKDFSAEINRVISSFIPKLVCNKYLPVMAIDRTGRVLVRDDEKLMCFSSDFDLLAVTSCSIFMNARLLTVDSEFYIAVRKYEGDYKLCKVLLKENTPASL